ncbi:MAG: leucine-rich repeat domain-containing protein, partial [Ruminococcus sp.]|nr:leucine-rich repeat domain-containing protein [Ruminococcus sp.]
FWECSSLKKVTIGSSVKTIGYNAFCKCTSLESITLPDGLESIGDCAFEYCRNLTKISIPSSVTEIGGSAFSCTGGLTITAPEGSKAEEYAKKYGYSYCGSQINDTDRRVYYGLPYTPGQAGAGECHRGS